MIQLQGVNKIHGLGGGAPFQALYDIDLNIEAGQVVVLQGVSGSGKSTLLSIIGALQKPTSGEVVVDGRRIAKLPDRHASAFRLSCMGFIFQSFNLIDEFTVKENVAVPLVPARHNFEGTGVRIAEALAAARIDHKSDQPVRDLSGGEKQRVAIARALVNKPKIVLCDEPTANLDRDNVQAFQDILSGLKEQGKTLMIATHDPDLTSWSVVDRVLRLAEGRVLGP